MNTYFIFVGVFTEKKYYLNSNTYLQFSMICLEYDILSQCHEGDDFNSLQKFLLMLTFCRSFKYTRMYPMLLVKYDQSN